MTTATECDNPVNYGVYFHLPWYIAGYIMVHLSSHKMWCSPKSRLPNSALPTRLLAQALAEYRRQRGPTKTTKRFWLWQSTVPRCGCQQLVYYRVPAVCPVIRDAGEPRAKCCWTKFYYIYRFYKRYGIPISLHKLLPSRVMRICATQHPRKASAPFTGPPHTLFVCLLRSRLYNRV